MNINGHPIGLGSLLIFIAVLIFAVGFGVLTWGDPSGKFLWQDLLLGSAFFSAGHIVSP